MAKDSVKKRFAGDGPGMSFTEFTYQLIQGYDFYHLHKEYNCLLQMGGSDQWGNIIAGTDLIRKIHSKQAYGITFPLLTKSDGQKFGKSEKGAIWLSPDKVSPYEFYQYLIRVEDADVIKLMRMLTFMDMAEIHEYERKMQESGYVPRTAQKRLAEEITRIVHGSSGLEKALKVTEGIAPGTEATLNVEILESLAADMPNRSFKREEILNKKVTDVLFETGMQPSKGEARRMIKNGGVSINNVKISEEGFEIKIEHFIEERLLLLAAGKKNKLLIRLIS